MRAKRHRISTAVRLEPEVHEMLRETADEVGVSVSWLINRFCLEGLERMDLSDFHFGKKA